MNQNHFWNLLTKKFSGEAFAERTAQLEQLAMSRPERTFPAPHLAGLWPVENKDKNEKSLQKQRQKQPTRRQVRGRAKAAQTAEKHVLDKGFGYGCLAACVWQRRNKNNGGAWAKPKSVP